MTPPYVNPPAESTSDPHDTPPSPPPASIAALSGARVAMLIGFGVIIFFVLSTFIVGSATNALGISFLTAFVATLVVQPAVLLGITYGLAVRRWGLSWADLGLVPMARRWFWIVPLVWLASLPVTALVRTITDRLMGTPGENPYGDLFDKLGEPTIGLVVVSVIFIGIVIPFAEEVVFRGVLYPWLRDRMRVLLAVPVSALVFGTLHIDIAVVPGVFFLGVVMALLRERSGTIWAPYLFHAIQNSLTTLLLFWLEAQGIDPTTIAT